MFLEGAVLSGCENILLGDLNFHLDQHGTWTLKFYDILEQFSFTQLVNTPTHIQGHILDALCVRDYASNCSRYQAAINHYNFLLEKSKCNHYSNIVAENQGNPKALWNCFKKILHRSSVAVLSDGTNKTDLANTFCKFFYDKILKIRSTLQSSTPSSVTRRNSTKNTLSSFTPVSEEDILQILKSSPSKSCDLDPISTSLVKECAILITPITKIVNYSIKEGSFPNCFKMAYVTPLQKKLSLDRNTLKNYRPVSNLSFISKLIEKVVAKQLNELISHEGLLNVNQSAYKSSHSTETTLLKM